ncbi:hypothetical protein D3C75_1044740 [compost metagenome]
MNFRSNLPATTLSKKLLVLEVIPSLTVTLMVEVPVIFAAGFRLMLLSGPSPENVMLAFGKSDVFDEVALSVSTSPASTSVTLNGLDTGVFTGVTTLELKPVPDSHLPLMIFPFLWPAEESLATAPSSGLLNL